jgi:hypothetical protein
MAAALQRSRRDLIYIIFWPEFYDSKDDPKYLPTFIHEMTHVWQGENGLYPKQFMVSSVKTQTTAGVSAWLSAAIKNGELLSWETARTTSYAVPSSMIGKNWSQFNVEQQGNVIEQWYVRGMNRYDPRYPYIRDVILKRNRNAAYAGRPVLPQCGDKKIKAIQDRLVSLGYLKPQHADGLIGAQQKRNIGCCLQISTT